MQKKSRYILSIAGLDPSGGAGLLADIKVFEQLDLTGLGVASSVTYQTDDEFLGVKWLEGDVIWSQVKPLQKFDIKAIKIGLIENLKVLHSLVINLKMLFPEARIVWDPILKASAGFSFHDEVEPSLLKRILKNIYCFTPNLDEAEKLGKSEAKENALSLSKYCYVVLKGGHSKDNADDLLLRNGIILNRYLQERIEGLSKHGSGCVFSSVLASALVLGFTMEAAVKEAKEYTLAFLKSSDTLLGKHKNPLMTR